MSTPFADPTSAAADPHPLDHIGALDASYYALRLTGLVPLTPAALPPAGCTSTARFRLQAERAHPHSATDTTLQLPYHARNALILESVDTPASHPANAHIKITETSSDIPSDTPSDARTSIPLRQHPLDAPAAIANPTLPYRMAADSIEFFPLSALRLPYDLPAHQPINLTDWFMAECLAATHTYTQLMDPAAQAAFGIQGLRSHTYAHSKLDSFYPSGLGHAILIESVFYPTPGRTIADIITPDDQHPVPPHGQWFKLTATPQSSPLDKANPNAHLDVGSIGEMIPEDLMRGIPERPRTHYAAWMTYTLTHPGDTRSARRLESRTCALPYFCDTNHLGSLYQYALRLNSMDAPFREIAPNLRLPDGRALSNSLPSVTTHGLTQEARSYAQQLSAQRPSSLLHLSRSAVGRVVYSDLFGFTTSGRPIDLTSKRATAPLLARVSQPLRDQSAPRECVATPEQYIELHKLMSTHTRDVRLAGILSTPERDACTPEDIDITSRKAREASAMRSFVSGTSSRALTLATGPSTAAPRRGRPKGARSVLTYERFVAKVKEIGLMADNALREPNKHMSLYPIDPSNPTDNWTRLTPLMPPAPGSDLDQARFGRGLPVRAVSNQRIDSMLWHSLLNKWLNDPKMRAYESRRPPILQVMQLREPIVPLDPEEASIDYSSKTTLAYATIYIPIPARVMNEWLRQGPTPNEYGAVLPKTRALTGEYRRYLDSRIDPTTNKHERLGNYPEVMARPSDSSAPADLMPQGKCLPQPGPHTSWLLTHEQIEAAVDIQPISVTELIKMKATDSERDATHLEE